ncbi:MAG: hypothetical protein JWO58_3037 [Chitinophagaceae bacterium]|nr:hypothetical protein [Chitinophagaceae bacterium]
MTKKTKRILIILASIVIALIVLFKFFQYNTKKASPEETVTYSKNGKDLSVFYNRPSKRGREIFGGLVPYDKVWRTGANEATTFTTATNIVIGEKTLPAGKYTLWTIPGKEAWTVIFNSKEYGWGITFGGEASREAAADVLEVKVPVEPLAEPVELFTIAFEDADSLKLTFAWDKTKVAVPIK